MFPGGAPGEFEAVGQGDELLAVGAVEPDVEAVELVLAVDLVSAVLAVAGGVGVEGSVDVDEEEWAAGHVLVLSCPY